MTEPKCVTHHDGCACITAHRIELGNRVQELEAELEQLRKIAKLCRREMEHGFDLPSDVFDEVEVYYEAHGVFDCDCDDCVALKRGGDK